MRYLVFLGVFLAFFVSVAVNVAVAQKRTGEYKGDKEVRVKRKKSRSKSKNFRGERKKQKVNAVGDKKDRATRRALRKAARRSARAQNVGLSKQQRKARRRAKKSGKFKGERALQGITTVGGKKNDAHDRRSRRAWRKSLRKEGISLKKQERHRRKQSKTAGNFTGERIVQKVSVPGDKKNDAHARRSRRALRKSLRKEGISLKKQERHRRKQSKKAGDFKGERKVQKVSVPGGKKNDAYARRSRRTWRKSLRKEGISLKKQERHRRKQSKKAGNFTGERIVQKVSVPGDKKDDARARRSRRAWRKSLRKEGISLKKLERHRRKQSKTAGDFKGERMVQKTSVPGDKKDDARARRLRRAWRKSLRKEGVSLKKLERKARRQAKRTSNFQGERSVRVIPKAGGTKGAAYARKAQRKWQKTVHKQGKLLATEKRKRKKQGRKHDTFLGDPIVRITPIGKSGKRSHHSLLTRQANTKSPVRRPGLVYTTQEARWVAATRYGWQHFKSVFIHRTISAAKHPIKPKNLKYDKKERNIWFK